MNFREREKFISEYKKVEEIPVVFCPEYINSNLCELDDKPYLNKNDIKSFNWNTKTLILTEYGKAKVNRLKYNYHGIPFTLKIKGEKIFNGWFWYYSSSAACSRVYCTIMPDSDVINFKFRNDKYSCGPNPFNDKNTIDKLLSLKD